MQVHSLIDLSGSWQSKTCRWRHRNIEREKERGEKAAKDVKTKARAMAVALQTIGKFIVKKKVGENDKIFGR